MAYFGVIIVNIQHFSLTIFSLPLLVKERLQDAPEVQS